MLLSKETLPKVGEKFGALTVVGSWAKNANSQWVATVRCDHLDECGKEFKAYYTNLKNGQKTCKFCGKKYVKDEYRHVLRRFVDAKTRCENPNREGYKDYGGRGIKFNFKSTREAVLWVQDNFTPDQLEGDLDRIDNNGHYEPGNIRFVSRQTNARNKRTTVKWVGPDGPVLMMEIIDYMKDTHPDLPVMTLAGYRNLWYREGLRTIQQICERYGDVAK